VAGTIGHHLQVLEEAGLAQVVAKRLVRGIVAKYYTRTARVYIFDFPSEIKGSQSISVDMLVSARDQLQDALVEGELDSELAACGFPHVRLSAAQAREFRERVKALIDDFVNLEPDPEGQVYSLSMAFFRAPGYLQGQVRSEDDEEEARQ
ncbi:MAG: hypothetical protein J2P36_23570, partial [Ktedonobacteraceae bacterium]|nr:hypothetical protein [Ktedonobacteraceae bacterium]